MEPGGNGRHVLHHDAKPEDVDVVIDAVGPWWADRVARALAPLRSAEGGVGSLPRSISCLLYTSPSPRDRTRSRMPSSACKKKNL